MAKPGRPKGIPRTDAATRKGNGNGWGGPAKGPAAKAAAPFEPENKAAEGRGPPNWEAIRDKEARAEAAADLVWKVMNTTTNEALAVDAAEAIQNRRWGRPVSKQQITGADGGPIQVNDARDRLASRLDRLAAATTKGGTAGGPDASGG